MSEEEDWGFVITRHVNHEKVDEYWKECIRCIRTFHPHQKIVVIDDFSPPEFINKKDEERILNQDPFLSIVRSEFKGAGELLPYFYFHKYRWFHYAMIIHDTLFLTSSMDPYFDNMKKCNSDISYLWSFRVRCYDDEEDIKDVISRIENPNILLEQRKKDTWEGCFGNMSCIRYEFLDEMTKHHPQLFETILPHINTRQKRMTMERVLPILFYAHKNGERVETFFGDILDYCTQYYFEFALFHYDHYKMKTPEELSGYPIIKVWTGR